MGSITSFSIQPSIIANGDAISLDVLVKKNGIVEYSIVGDAVKFSNGKNSVQANVDVIHLNQTPEKLSGPASLVKIYAYFIGERNNKKEYIVQIN